MVSSMLPVNNPGDLKQQLNAVKTRKQTEEENVWTPWKCGYSLDELKSMQENDQDTGPLLKWKNGGNRPSAKEVELQSPAVRHYWHLWDSLQVDNGLLYKLFVKRDKTGQYIQLLTPQKLKPKILSQMHNSLLSGNLGKKKTTAKILQHFYWYEMREDISLWISKCETCAAINPPVKTLKAPL